MSCYIIFAQEKVKNPFVLANESMGDTANYLAPIIELENSVDLYPYQHLNFYVQACLTYNSFLSNNNIFYKTLANEYRYREALPDEIYLDDDALNHIKTATSNAQVVMINEQHWMPKHRYMGNVLLEFFYDKGFRYLCVEAIGEDAKNLNTRKYPLQKTGFYIKEPQFASFLRNALRIGYTLVPYDSGGSNRELSQAKNIYEQTLKSDPKAKVLVWSGIDHVLKHKSDRPRMAYYFKEMSGIDPFVIDQSTNDIYAPLLENKKIAVYFKGVRNGVDLGLINNIKENDFKIDPEARDKTIDIKLNTKTKQLIKNSNYLNMMVFVAKEFLIHRFEAVPLKNIILTNKSNINLKLPAGNYHIVICDKSCNIKEQKKINIK